MMGSLVGEGRNARRSSLALGTAALALAFAGPAGAEDLEWRVVRAEVRVLCPLTVGGGFEARTVALTGNVVAAPAGPALFSGQLAVDLRTLDTGIGLRNDHMRGEYLEIEKGPGFDKAVLSEIRLGDVDPGTFQGKSAFSGTLALHGSQRAIAGQAEIRREGSSIRVEASFPVVLADYGIPKPQYLGVGVKSEVQVKVSLVAARVGAP
jgi:polyisoprenoid-binding protein YceI